MNGSLVRIERRRHTRSGTIVSLKEGGSLDFEKGDEFEAYIDSYNNIYRYVDGKEFPIFNSEVVEEG